MDITKGARVCRAPFCDEYRMPDLPGTRLSLRAFSTQTRLPVRAVHEGHVLTNVAESETGAPGHLLDRLHRRIERGLHRDRPLQQGDVRDPNVIPVPAPERRDAILERAIREGERTLPPRGDLLDLVRRRRARS